MRGLDITFTTTANTDEEGRALLAAFNFPFKATEARTDVMAKKSMINRERKRAKLVAQVRREARGAEERSAK